MGRHETRISIERAITIRDCARPLSRCLAHTTTPDRLVTGLSSHPHRQTIVNRQPDRSVQNRVVSRRRPVLVVEGVSHRNSPRWTADGREIYYVSPDDAMMELTVQTVPSLTVSAPRQLFKLSRSATLLEVARNGRFLLLVHQVRADERPIVVDTAAISSTRR